ncbi:spore germination protein [Paenibacillus glycanilyticus]|uniref:spore germination protein n=1 Tax=Paenibacillus glycanilyticus TaxID=126569 RepID=UPI0020400E0B|nr:spore germination protein [Paenibacillus glycanilyticus]MCM3628421.1 spore germination protein [Paenibacillus glycanilyticus]
MYPNQIQPIESSLRQWFENCSDVIFRHVQLVNEDERWGVLFVYCEGLSDDKLIDQSIIPQLEKLSVNQVESDILGNLSFTPLEKEQQSIVDEIFSGKLLVIFDHIEKLYSLDISNPPQRQPQESNTEVSVKGPRDGFTEQISTNIALIRKRLRTRTMCCESFVIGRRSRTKVSLLYESDIINPKILETARKRLRKIDVDALVSSEELAEYISDSPFKLFPSIDYIGRPDFAVEAILRGRFVIIVDGTPMVLIAPATLSALLKTPEDIHASYIFVACESFLRYLGLFIGIFVPGFYVALTSFHLDQIPITTLATVINVSKGLPIPAPLEAFLMQITFELFREAGIRLPKGVGQTVTVVGGLFIGQAAIDAGLTSSAMLVVTALSMVSTYTLVNQSLSGLVTLLRLFILACSSFLGMYGFFWGMFALLIYLSRMQSFGVPYLAPMSPPVFKDMLMALFSKPRNMVRTRPLIYSPQDLDRKEGEK